MGSIRKYDSSLSWCEFILTEIKIKNKRVASPYLNRKPQKTYKGSFNLRIDPQLHKNIYKQALKESLSINAFIGKTLKDAVN
jgi:predicted HicB family RNase H-like nuclease